MNGEVTKSAGKLNESYESTMQGKTGGPQKFISVRT